MNAQKITTLFATDPDGSEAARGHPARARLPARRRRLSRWRTGGAWHSRIVAILKVGLPLVALGLLSALFLVQTDDRLGGRRLLAGRRRGARQRAADHQPDLHRHDRAARTASASPPTQVVPDAAPPQRAAITDARGHARPARRAERHGAGGHRRSRHSDPAAGPEPARSTIATSDGYRIDADKATLDLQRRRRSSPETMWSSRGPLGRITSGSLHVAPASRRAARRVASLSETACGWYTIRRTRSEDAVMRAGWLAAMLVAVLPGLGAGAGRPGAVRRASHDATLAGRDHLRPPRARPGRRHGGLHRHRQGRAGRRCGSRPTGSRSSTTRRPASGHAPAQVQRMVANGNVTLSNGAEAAEASRRPTRSPPGPSRWTATCC